MYIFFQIPNRAFGCFRRLSTNGSMSFLIDKQVRPYIHTKSLLNRISLRLLVPFFLSFFPSRHGRVLCFRFYRVSTTCGTGGERHQERRKKNETNQMNPTHEGPHSNCFARPSIRTERENGQRPVSSSFPFFFIRRTRGRKVMRWAIQLFSSSVWLTLE